VLASAPAWAVRPSAASARSVGAPAFFLPAWSHLGDHHCSSSGQKIMRPAHSSLGQHGTSLCRFTLAALGLPIKNSTAGVDLTLKHQMPEVSTRQRCAARASSQSPSTVASGGRSPAPVRWWRRVPGISLLSVVRLTPPSSGPACGRPLISNVRPLGCTRRSSPTQAL
jgi:hypothetical protein